MSPTNCLSPNKLLHESNYCRTLHGATPIPPHCIQGKSGRTPHNSVLVSIPLQVEVHINFL